MQAVKVQYTVQPTFAKTNAANIRKVMDALKASSIEGVSYLASLKGDDQTFVHIVVAQDEASRLALTELPEFGAFQAALKASDPVSLPTVEDWTVVGASFWAGE